ncbi:MAG: nitrous oxide-stimulated promoter family protein [Verrucomicrobia bacterium]|nr:nitrous oxide-stimulated promoter family protein [Verrucomicrobiota bacterium]
MKREDKQKTAQALIRLYCRAKHQKQPLCGSCAELLRYVTARLNECRLPEESSTCFMCPDYCYRSDVRESIREVMRFSAPRSLIHHPILMIKHLRHLRKLHRHL